MGITQNGEKGIDLSECPCRDNATTNIAPKLPFYRGPGINVCHLFPCGVH